MRRSARRTKTVQARRYGERTVVTIPAHLSKAQEEQVVADLVARLDKRRAGRRPPASDADLLARAERLIAEYLPEVPMPASVRWVSNQKLRWGSCTYENRTIRLSDRLQRMPAEVVDAVLVHELAHLVEPNHGPQFTELINRYEKTEWAEGFLAAVTWHRGQDA